MNLIKTGMNIFDDTFEGLDPETATLIMCDDAHIYHNFKALITMNLIDSLIVNAKPVFNKHYSPLMQVKIGVTSDSIYANIYCYKTYGDFAKLLSSTTFAGNVDRMPKVVIMDTGIKVPSDDFSSNELVKIITMLNKYGIALLTIHWGEVFCFNDNSTVCPAIMESFKNKNIANLISDNSNITLTKILSDGVNWYGYNYVEQI